MAELQNCRMAKELAGVEPLDQNPAMLPFCNPAILQSCNPAILQLTHGSTYEHPHVVRCCGRNCRDWGRLRHESDGGADGRRCGAVSRLRQRHDEETVRRSE